MPPGTIIDIDVVEPWRVPDRPARPARPARSPSRRIRSLAIGLLIGAVVLASSGDARATPLSPRLTFEDVVQVSLVDRHAVLTRAGSGGSTVELVDLADGARRWAVTIDAQVVFADMRRIVVAYDPETSTRSGLAALDSRTGRRVWQREDARYVGQGGGLLLAQGQAPTTEPPSGSLANPATVRWPRRERLALDPATGGVRWSVTVPAGTLDAWAGIVRDGGYERTAMVELDPDGSLRKRDSATGDVALRTRLDGAVPGRGLSILDDRVFVLGSGGDRIEAYDLRTGHRQWVAALTEADLAGFLDCGDVLCQFTRTGLRAIDPRDGRQLWTRGQYAELISPHGGHLVLSELDLNAAPQSSTVVVDPRTGAPLRDLRGWRMFRPVDDRRFLASRHTGRRTVTIAAMDPDTGHRTVIGTMPHWSAQPYCQLRHGFVACLDRRNSLALWRYPS